MPVPIQPTPEAPTLPPGEWSRRIRAAREAAGLTQQQVADGLGITKQSYHQLEAGARNPSADRLVQLAALGLDPAILAPELGPRKKSRSVS